MEELNGGGTEAPRENAKRYNAIKVRLTVVDIAVNFLFITALAFSGISTFVVTDVIAPHITHDYLAFLAFLAIVSIAGGIIGLPLDFYGSFIIEHRFGLSNQGIGRWAFERVKALLVNLAIGIPLSLIFFAFLRTAGRLWWLYLAATVFLLAIVLARLAPVIILPLFYKFEPLDEGPVTGSIRALVEKHGIPIRGIFTFNMSRDTKKANAGFTGIGKSRRVILSDTLMEEFTQPEILTVFAHELGHYVKRHILRGISFNGVVIFLALYLCGLSYDLTWTRLGHASRQDIAALPVLFFYLTIFGLLLMPLSNYLSRRFEREADRFAIEITGDAGAFISSMDKLANMNLADREPNAAVEALFYSHPSISKRIAFARSMTP